jgi:putative ABC transport system permease protein
VSLAYPYRQGMANLHRPNNQTVLLLLSLGLGTFLIVSLVLSERAIVGQIEGVDSAEQPSIVFFDVQSDQLASVAATIREEGLPVLDQVPIVNMRIASVKGRTIAEMRADSVRHEVTWAHTREYRSSYRGHLTDAERLVSGAFTPRVEPGTEVVPVSMEVDLAGRLDVTLGDTIVFDVQGMPVTTLIGSLREVDWRRMQTNFFVLFPEGVLEEAPQTFVVLTRTDAEAAGNVQASVIMRHPNVSAIDLAMILDVFDNVFGRIAAIIRFMALFSVFAGFVVLSAALVASRAQRARESVLLKALGASKRQVLQIALIEYALLGTLAALTGVILAYGAAALMMTHVFEMPFRVGPWPVVVAIAAVASSTIAIGLLGSRGVYERPAREVLQAAE